MTTAIVTDSTSDLNAEWLGKYGITSIPLYVLFGGELYQDGVQIQSAELFSGIRAGARVPSTSQPSPAEFAQTYRSLLENADQVLSIHISGLLSGTVGSARLGAEEFGDRVTVLDSRSVTLGLGLQAIRAAELAREGHSVADIVATLQRVQQVNDLRFSVDTLDFLKLNGRIGGAAAFLGGLLNIKPMLVVRGGRVEGGARVRGQKKALSDLTSVVADYQRQHGGARVAFLATPGGEESRAEVRAQVEAQSEGLNWRDMGDHSMGAVVATHAGPGAFGVALEPLDA